ncbi:MAG: cyclase family protein [Methanomicrobiales archaeon]
MVIHDITRPLSPDTPVYPGDATPVFTEEHGQYRITHLSMSSHSGTHIDAPRHYLDDGQSIDQVPLGLLCGPAQVIDCRGVDGPIEPADLGIGEGIFRVLLRTRCSEETVFGPAYPYITLDAADHLVDRGVRVVGVDTPSVEVFGGDGTVHRHLLSGGVIPLEFLDLGGIDAGTYWMAALPLRLAGRDGAPARVILIDDSGGRI